MQSYFQSEMFLSNFVDVMKNLPKVILYSGNFGKIEVSWVYSVVLMKFCFSPKIKEGWTTKMTPVTTKRHKLTFKGVSLCLKGKCWDTISIYIFM